MKTLFAKNKSNDKQVNHKSNDVSKKAKETRDELKKPENAGKSPNIFQTFVSWVKSIFTKEPNLEPGATQNGNMNADSAAVPRTAVNNTLPPKITGEAVKTDKPVHMPEPKPVTAAASPETGETVTVEIPESVQNNILKQSEAPNKEISPEENIINTEEKSAEKTEEKAPEFTPGVNVTEDNEIKPESTEKVTIGNISFDTFKIENYTFALSGTVKVLGKDVKWKSDKKISLVQEVKPIADKEAAPEEDKGNYFGSGEITFAAEGLSYKNESNVKAEVVIINNEISYRVEGGLLYTQDGIKLSLGEEFKSFDEITATKIPLLNYSLQSDPPMLGGITIGSGGFDGFAQKDIAWFPTALFKGVKPPVLKLAKNEDNKLGISLAYDGDSDDVKNIKLSAGIENVAEIKAEEPVKAVVLESGEIKYGFSGSGFVSFFGKPVDLKFDLTSFNITIGQGLTGMEVPEFDLDIGGVQLKKIALNFTGDGGKISAGSIGYKNLKINGLSGELGESGITAGAAGFEFPIGGQTLSGSLQGFEWKKGAKTFTVSKFELSAEKFSFGKNINVDSASMNFSLSEDSFSFTANGTFSAEEIKTDLFSVSASKLTASFSLEKNDEEKPKLAAKVEGSIKFSVGKDDAVEASAENISYENGEFGVEKLELSTTFEKLIPGNFSGSANLTANGLKFSDKVELDSLGAKIKNLKYNEKTLINSADAEIFFKEDSGKAAEVDSAELAAGESTGILKNARISIYILNDKKGVNITAEGFEHDFEYLSVNFTNVEAGIFTSGGENKISSDRAEIKSGKKLNEFLKADSFSLAASKCQISSKGIEIGEVTASVSELKLAEALTVNSLEAKMTFDENMAFQSFTGKSSAMFGNISVSDLELTVSKKEEKLSADLKTKEIACGEDLYSLKITDAEGSYSDGRVTVNKAAFSFMLAQTAVTGELKNLSWSKADDFSAEEMTVKADKIDINDSLSINQGKIAASIKNKSFSIGAEAALQIGEFSNGLVKIDATELSLSLNFSSEKKDDKSKFSASGSVTGSIGVVFGDNIASGKVSDIKYEDGEFSVGGFGMETDLSKFAGQLGGSGQISVNSLKFSKDKTPALGSAKLTVLNVTYNSKALMDSLSVNLILDSKTEPDKENTANAAEASLGLDNDVNGVLGGVDVWVYLTNGFKGVKMNAKTLGITAGNFQFNFDSFSGEFGSNGCVMTLGKFSMQTDIAKTLGIENLEFTAKDAAVKDNKFTVGSISAKAGGVIKICGFEISNVTADTSFDDKWSLTGLELGGDLNCEKSVSVSGLTVKYSGEEKEGAVLINKLTYKELTIETLTGSIGKSGITAGAEKFEFPINGQTISGTLQNFKWEPGKSFTVSQFSVTASTLSFGELIALNDAGIKFSLSEEGFSFLAEGTLSVKKIETGVFTVNADALKIKFSMGDGSDDKTKDESSDKSKISASVEGAVKFSVGTDNTVEAAAENISYEDGKFGVEKLELSTTFDKLISGNFSGNANLTAQGLKFSKEVELASLMLSVKDLAYCQKKLVNSAKAEIIIREDQSEKTVDAVKDAQLATGEDTGGLQNAKLSIYLLKDKKGVKLTADSLDYGFEYLSLSFAKINAALFTAGDNEISSESAKIQSADKLNQLIGVEALSLSASDCRISSKGIELGKVNAEIKNLTIANALTLDGSSELEFGKKMALQKFEITASAKLGSISITGFNLKLTDKGGELKAGEIDCGEALRSLKINTVSGSFSKDKVTVSSKAFSFELAGKDFSGSLENLSWNSEESFSVDKMTVTSGKINITDGVSVEGGEITASIKNKSFSVGAKAKLSVSEIKSGMIKVSGAELEFSLNISDEKKDDKSELKISGSANGKIGVEIGGGIASANIDGVEYNDGEFSLGSFDMEADLSKLGSDMLGGSGHVFVNSLKLKKGGLPAVGSMGMKLSGLSYNGKNLINELSVNIILDSTVQPEKSGGGETAKADTAELSLSDGVSGMLNGLSVSVYLTEEFKGVQIDAESFRIKPKSFEFKFDKFSGKFGSEKGNTVCNMQLGGLTVNSELSENNIIKRLGVEKLTFTAENASIESNKLKLGKISAEVGGAVKLCGFEINDVKLDAEFSDDMELKSMKVGGALSYGKYVSGSAALTVDDNGIKFDEIGDIKVSYGCFAGKLTTIEIDNSKEGTFKLQQLELEKRSSDDGESDFAETKQGSLMGKFIRSIPNIKIEVKEISFVDGSLIKPSMDDITVSEFKKDFELVKGIKGSIGYSGGEKGEFTIEGTGKFALPDGEEPKRITFLTVPVPIIPPVLSAKFNLGMSAKLDTEAGFSLKAARDENKLNFDTQLKAHANALFGIYAEAALEAQALLMSIEGGIRGEANLKAEFILDGKLGVVYDPKAESFFKAFSVAKEKTSVDFEAGGTVELKAALYGRVGGLPAIFSKKSLSHSWELGKYTLAGINIKGAVAYDHDEGRYRFSADPEITNANSFDAYSPKVTSDRIAEFGNTLSELQNGMKSINSLLDRVKGGVNQNSSDGIVGTNEDDLGKDIQGGKDKIMTELKKRIDNTFQKSRESSVECHVMMVNLRKLIESNAEKMAENEFNIKQIENVLAQSNEALNIIGYEKGGDGLTMEKYQALIQKLEELKKDEEQLNKLAVLEPAAVVNMFKALKPDSIFGNSPFKNYGELSAKDLQIVDEDSRLESVSQIDTGIYGVAMKDLAKVLSDNQKASDKQEALLAAARQAFKAAEEEKRSLDEKHDQTIKTLNERIAGLDLEKINAEEDEACKKDLAAIEEYGKKRGAELESEKKSKVEEARTLMGKKEIKVYFWEKKELAELSAAVDRAVAINQNTGYESKLGSLGARRTVLENHLQYKMSPEERAAKEEELEKIKAEEKELEEKLEPTRKKVADADKAYARFFAVRGDLASQALLDVYKLIDALHGEIEKSKKDRQDRCQKTKEDKAYELQQCKNYLIIEEQIYKQRSPVTDQKYTAAKNEFEEMSRASELLKQQLEQKGDISTAMKGFQEFISVEHKRTEKIVGNARRKYALPESAETPAKLDANELAYRRKGIIAIIDRVIKDKTNDEKQLKQYGKNLDKIQSKENIVDHDMKGFGLSKYRDSVKMFETMKSDNEKFTVMREQLDTIYNRLTDFHGVMRQTLESWNAANGLDFSKKDKLYSISDLSDSSSKAISLIEDTVSKTNNAEKNRIDEAELKKLSDEFNQLNNSDVAVSDASSKAEPVPDQQDEARRLAVG